MGDLDVVCHNIDVDEPSHGLDAIEGIAVEPLVLERPPPGLDQGVREAYIPQRQQRSSSALTAPRAAARRIATVVANSNFSATDQARIFRE